jgi:predicted metal-binding membrane protein
MMSPSTAFVLLRYRTSFRQQDWGRTDKIHLGKLISTVATAYFCIWLLLGVVVYGLGITLARVEMQHPALAGAVPIVTLVRVLLAGTLQFTAWKTHHLACCRLAPEPETLEPNLATACRQGRFFGFHCGCCCLNLTVILLVLGVMELRAMAVITAATTLERLAPADGVIVGIIEATALGLGTLLLLRAVSVV